MKKLIIAMGIGLSLIGATHAADTLRIGATPAPHAEILEFVKPTLAKEGVELDIKVFNDYVQPNIQLEEKALDANFFQHEPYLKEFNSSRGTHVVSVTGVHIEPFGGYSKTLKDIKELKDGAKVAIPNDATNGGRALLLLEKVGLIKLKDNKNILSTVRDVTENSKKLKFVELEAAMLPRALDDVDLALINTNFALEAKLDPTKDALFIEDKDSPYVNIIAAREDNKNSSAMKTLVKELHSEKTRNFINERYKGAIIPAY